MQIIKSANNELTEKILLNTNNKRADILCKSNTETLIHQAIFTEIGNSILPEEENTHKKRSNTKITTTKANVVK